MGQTFNTQLVTPAERGGGGRAGSPRQVRESTRSSVRPGSDAEAPATRHLSRKFPSWSLFSLRRSLLRAATRSSAGRARPGWESRGAGEGEAFGGPASRAAARGDANSLAR